MKITLEKLTLKNFKGIVDYEVNFNGENTSIFGDNGTGKTTLYDACNWLLFDKDSNNKKEFGIKTLDENGEPIHNLTHEVCGIFKIDGEEIELKKIFQEKWVKPHGKKEKILDSHKTYPFINGVPVKSNEYKAKIKSIIDEDLFKLLTSPAYFNTHMDWESKRSVLLDINGDVSTADVIASNRKLAPLTALLGNHTVEDYTRIVTAEKARIDKELKPISGLIDENRRQLPVIPDGTTEQSIKDAITTKEAEIVKVQEEIIDVRSGVTIAAKEKAKIQIETKMIELTKNTTDDNTALQNLRTNRQTQEEKQLQLNREIATTNQTIKNLEIANENDTKRISAIGETQATLRTEWMELNAKNFTLEQTACETCGQTLPASKIEEARTVFNTNKSNRLKELSVLGTENNNETARLQEKITKRNTVITDHNTEINNKTVESQNIQVEIEKLKQQTTTEMSTQVDVTTTPEYTTLVTKKATIEEEIKQLQLQNESVITTLQNKLVPLRTELTNLNADLLKFGQITTINIRIKELEEREEELVVEYTTVEKNAHLIDLFTTTKVKMLQARINDKFKMAKFKLFETQLNGSIKECCVTTVDGVPYDTSLNTAAKINVGLDIINTLSEHYDTYAPIFIDNAESVTELLPTDSQTMSLYVSKDDKELRIVSASQVQKQPVNITTTSPVAQDQPSVVPIVPTVQHAQSDDNVMAAIDEICQNIVTSTNEPQTAQPAINSKMNDVSKEIAENANKEELDFSEDVIQLRNTTDSDLATTGKAPF